MLLPGEFKVVERVSAVNVRQSIKDMNKKIVKTNETKVFTVIAIFMMFSIVLLSRLLRLITYIY